MTTTTTVSSPGKALIAGGYLVLESPNPGLVLAADKRFHCTVTSLPPTDCKTTSKPIVCNDGSNVFALDVHSPQFDVVFQYWVKYCTTTTDDKTDAEEAIKLSPRDAEHHTSNIFIERTLLLTLCYIRHSLGTTTFHEKISCLVKNDGGKEAKEEEKALAIKLRADNDFYSLIPHLTKLHQEATSQNVSSLPPFLPCPKVKDEETGEEKLVVNKTGMGSSAALVTSLVGALLKFFNVVTLPHSTSKSEDAKKEEDNDEEEGLKIAHNLAQICHCHAQGKVGSGFDVSSAIHGSHVYTRFSKHVIATLLEELEEQYSSSSSTTSFSSSLSQALSIKLYNSVTDKEKTWDATVQPLSLPPGIELLMADVCGGSESPSMARKILAWKKSEERMVNTEDDYWTNLMQVNKEIQELFEQELGPESELASWMMMMMMMKKQQQSENNSNVFAMHTAKEWDTKLCSFDHSSKNIAKTLLKMQNLFFTARTNLRKMGEAAGVPVEPKEQEELANATMDVPGVVAAGVPGAGGYDALFVLYVKGVVTGDDNGGGSGGVSDEVRDKIGDLWRNWGKEKTEGDEGGSSSVCPLAVRAAGSGGVHGLCETDLGW